MVAPIWLTFFLACDQPQETDENPLVCPLFPAVVTDIDETLTTTDEEFLTQLTNPSYDPEMRPDANTLLQAYSNLGYSVFYITARASGMTLSDGRTATEVTEDWLDDHAFPRDEGSVYLYDSQFPAVGEAAVEYKAAALEGLKDTYELRYAYGNATTDIDAFLQAGIDESNIFLVGELAGQMGVSAITDDEAYTLHLADQLDEVEDMSGLECS